jgi:predicted phosphodiesterase
VLIRLISDIHLEFGKDWEPIIPPMAEDSETILVAAGDIHTGTDACEFLQQASSRFAHVLYVLGNHEFYHNDLDTLAGYISEELGDFDNITLLDNESLVLGDVRFIGSTLWTDMNKRSPVYMGLIERAMQDYDHIKKGGQRIFATDTIDLHEEAVSFLEAALSQPHEGPTVVVTHHLPSFKSVHPCFHGVAAQTINGAFYSDLDEIMYDNDIAYWLHGHTHQTVEYELSGTKVRMNPLGYGSVEDLENPRFDPNWRIEV